MPMPTSFVRTRRCPGCRRDLSATTENFYVRPSTGHMERCFECLRAYEAGRAESRRLARRNGVSNGRSSVGRRFGVEIEYIGGGGPSGTRSAIAVVLRAAGLEVQVENYNHSTRRHWKLVGDGSLSGHNAGELVSPPLRGDEGRRQVELACRALRSVGADVNTSCGLHVHHDVGRMNATAFGRVFRLWLNNQQHVDQLVSTGRRTSTWCKPLTEHP